jgi:hypothetical protein
MKAHSHFKGSGIRFGKIVYTRKYHPPLYTKKDKTNPTVAGQWNEAKKEITVYLAGFKKSGYNADSYITRQEYIRVINHEVLHGVIDYIIQQDNILFKGIDHHWPFDKGLEYDSSF